MTLRLKWLGLNTILAAALAAAPALAQTPSPLPAPPPDNSKDAATAKLLTDLDKKCDTIISRLDKMEKRAELEMAGLQLQIDQLRKDVDALRKPASTRQAFTIQPNDASTGRVLLINDYLSPVTIVVNDRSYNLMPGEMRQTLPLPAGTFSYEVLNIQARRYPTLAANETFKVRVYPQY